MDIKILTGTAEAAKREYLTKIKTTFNKESVKIIDLKGASFSDLENLILSRSFFDSEKRLIIVENIPLKFDLKKLTAISDPSTILFVTSLDGETSELIKTAKTIRANIIPFTGEKELQAFLYLDYLIERKKDAFLELNKLLEKFGGIYVISMIYYLLRRNILPLPNSSFLQKKISNQKKSYQLSDWQNIYKFTLTTEYNIKMGIMEEKGALVMLTQKIIDLSERAQKNFGK